MWPLTCSRNGLDNCSKICESSIYLKNLWKSLKILPKRKFVRKLSATSCAKVCIPKLKFKQKPVAAHHLLRIESKIGGSLKKQIFEKSKKILWFAWQPFYQSEKIKNQHLFPIEAQKLAPVRLNTVKIVYTTSQKFYSGCCLYNILENSTSGFQTS